MTTLIPRGLVEAGQEAHFLKFVCPPTFDGGPFDEQPATRLIERNLLRNIDLPLPPEVEVRTRTGRNRIELWIIEDPTDPNGRIFPSPLVRTVRGDVVHATVGFRTNTHTIHWHGIEPTTLNDGVGHLSFEGTSSFVYQFATNTAGTYFYHCHKNTVLHFENGLYGFLVVDPPNPDPGAANQAPYPTFGAGFAAANVPGFPGFDPVNLVVPYDVEALWAVDEFDSVWHELGHNAFMQDCDANDPIGADTFTNDGILNNFRPDIFVISGVVSVPTTAVGVAPEIGAPILDPRVAVTAGPDQTVLIRLLNSGYAIQEYTLGLDVVVIASDGYAFGVPPINQYSSPFRIPAGRPFRLTTARRLDLLVRTPSEGGVFPVLVKYYDWLHGPDSGTPKLFHVAETQIVVSP